MTAPGVCISDCLCHSSAENGRWGVQLNQPSDLGSTSCSSRPAFTLPLPSIAVADINSCLRCSAKTKSSSPEHASLKSSFDWGLKKATKTGERSVRVCARKARCGRWGEGRAKHRPTSCWNKLLAECVLWYSVQIITSILPHSVY